MLSNKIIVAAPKIADRAVKKPLLCGPGPCDVWPSVEEAYSKPILSPLCDEYFNVVDDIRAGVKYIFQTRSKLVLAISGSGHAGMEAVISNLVQPGETMLIASRGIWDERALRITERHGIKAAITRVPNEATFSLIQLEKELKKVRPHALFITHGDSSTGTVQNLQGIGELCHNSKLKSKELAEKLFDCPKNTETETRESNNLITFAVSLARDLAFSTNSEELRNWRSVERGDWRSVGYGALFLVDTVVSLVGVPFFMDEWGVDGVYSSTQKALSGPAGISPIAFSARAEEKINKRKHEPPFYLDIKLLAPQWNCYGNTKAKPWLRRRWRDELDSYKKDWFVKAQNREEWKEERESLPCSGTYHHTLSPPLLWALRACLQEVTKETLPKAWARHATSTAHFHKRLQQLSFQFMVPKPEDRLPTVTTIILPKGYDYVQFWKYMRAKHNILIFPGLGPTAGKALRIGIMGINSTIEVADAVADAMADTMRAMTKASL